MAASGAICASTAHALLVPIDTVKIRMQTAAPGKYKNIFDATDQVLNKEGGFSALARGLQPEFVGFGLYGAVSFGGTEYARRTLTSLAGVKWSLLYPIPIVVVASVFASILATLLNTPFMYVKTRMIADEDFAGSSLTRALTRVREEEGFSELFGAAAPLVLKDVTFVMSKFAMFDVIKNSLYTVFPYAVEDVQATLLVSLASGSIAGVLSAVTSQPGDYLFSKAAERQGATLQTAWSEYIDSKRYSDILTGLAPRIVFSAALIALQFVIYDYCRVQFHVSAADLNVFLDVMANVGVKPAA